MKTTKYKCSACAGEFEKSIRLESECGVFQGCPYCGCWDFSEKKKTFVRKEELTQYTALVRELDSAEKKLSELKARGRENSELYELTHNNRLRCMALRMRIESFIFDIDDSLMRQIFEARYIRGLSWKRISYSMDGIYSDDYLRIMHDRYLKKLQSANF